MKFLAILVVYWLIIIVPLTGRSQQTGTFLETGWYGISSEQNSHLRIEAKTNDSLFVDPDPILTVNDFASLTIRDGPPGYNYSELVFKLKDSLSSKWENATRRYTGLKIGFVLNNQLIQVLTVHEPIYDGFTMIAGFPVEELERIKKQMERDMREK